MAHPSGRGSVRHECAPYRARMADCPRWWYGCHVNPPSNPHVLHTFRPHSGCADPVPRPRPNRPGSSITLVGDHRCGTANGQRGANLPHPPDRRRSQHRDAHQISQHPAPHRRPIAPPLPVHRDRAGLGGPWIVIDPQMAASREPALKPCEHAAPPLRTTRRRPGPARLPHRPPPQRRRR